MKLKIIIILVLMASIFFSCKKVVYEVFNQNNEKISEFCRRSFWGSHTRNCFYYKKTDIECGE